MPRRQMKWQKGLCHARPVLQYWGQGVDLLRELTSCYASVSLRYASTIWTFTSRASGCCTIAECQDGNAVAPFQSAVGTTLCTNRGGVSLGREQELIPLNCPSPEMTFQQQQRASFTKTGIAHRCPWILGTTLSATMPCYCSSLLS